MKPSVFIGSTEEAKQYAEKVARGLESIGNCILWCDDGTFEAAGNTLNSLSDKIRNADFVVIILTADDKTTSRGEDFVSPRDNLILEAGLGIGALGANRTFIVPEHVESPKVLKLPTDLGGFNLTASFQKKENFDNINMRAALFDIEHQINNLGPKPIYRRQLEQNSLDALATSLIKSASRNIALFGRDLSWAERYSEAIKNQAKAGIEVEVFSESPRTDLSKSSSKILENAGAKVYHSDRDHGLRVILIDHHDSRCSRLMVVFKERTNRLGGDHFIYNCEIHNTKDSWIMWNTFTRLYELIRQQFDVN